MIPGLENAEFLRFGQMHRNTYINSPALLQPTLQLKTRSANFFRGTDFGRGRLCRIHRHRIDGRPERGCPRRRRSASGVPARDRARQSCATTSTQADAQDFQPANITFDLLPALDEETKRTLQARQESAPRGGLPAVLKGVPRILSMAAMREICVEVSG